MFSSGPLPANSHGVRRFRQKRDYCDIITIGKLEELHNIFPQCFSFFVIRNLNNLCVIISFRPTISIQSCPRWAHNPRNSFKLYFLHFSLLWNLRWSTKGWRGLQSWCRAHQSEFSKTNVERASCCHQQKYCWT